MDRSEGNRASVFYNYSKRQDTLLINVTGSMVFPQTSSSPQLENWLQVSSIMKKILPMRMQPQISSLIWWSRGCLKNSPVSS